MLFCGGRLGAGARLRRTIRSLLIACCAVATKSATATGTKSTRLTVDTPNNNRSLLLDGQPWQVRGVTYNPTPVGEDPSYGHTDYHADEFAAMHARDVRLLSEAGVNMIRLYAMGHDDKNQKAFWDQLHAANISVMAGIELYTQGACCDWGNSMMLADAQVMERMKNELRHLLALHDHPAITMWNVGNEMNWVGQNWVGDTGRCSGGCLFADDAKLLFESVNELCGVVVEEFGKMCTTVLADVPVPQRYADAVDAGLGGFEQWAQLFEETIDTRHMALLATNLYRGASFGAVFSRRAAAAAARAAAAAAARAAHRAAHRRRRRAQVRGGVEPAARDRRVRRRRVRHGVAC